MDRIERAEKAIIDQCELLLASDAFGAWRETETFHADDLVICNNSFLFREGRTTTKNSYHIGFLAVGNGDFVLPPSVVRATSRINLQFKRVSVRSLGKYQFLRLGDALAEQFPQLGSIVFSLVGSIGDPQPAQVAISGVDGLRILQYVPDQSATVQLADGVLSLAGIADLDTAWTSVHSHLVESDIDVVALGDAFEPSFHELQEAAARPIDLTAVSEEGSSILGNVLDRIQEQSDAFAEFLGWHRERPDDAEVYNELLRVAYNFADGARAFLGLMVGICDLKPLIFWMTIFEQVELAHCFAELPFALVGRGKPSLERYRSVIAEARNQAFHDLFAFDHPFRVDLSADALRAPQLRLFREYGRRNDPVLTFEDRSLVELLQALTRTSERPVPLGFWEGNLKVMRAVVEVVRALRHALVIVVD